MISSRLQRLPDVFVIIFGAQLRKANEYLDMVRSTLPFFPTGGCQAPAALLVLAALKAISFMWLFGIVAMLQIGF